MAGCYCGGERSSRIVQPFVIQRPATRRAFAISAVLHAVVVVIAWQTCDPTEEVKTELVDIELAPEPPPVEALPEEVAKRRDDTHAAPNKDKPDEAPPAPPPPPEEPAIPIDAGIDAP